MLTIDVVFDGPAFERKLAQIPFATALALTRTAQDAQTEVRRELGQRFVLRNNWVRQGILFTPARKDRLEATVFSRDYFMKLQETGGVKTAARSKDLAIPSDVRRTKREAITRANRPRALLAKKGTFVATIRGLQGIWQRVGKRTAKKTGRTLRLLYVFKPSAVIRPRFGFANMVRKVVRERFPRHFALALEQALRTAR